MKKIISTLKQTLCFVTAIVMMLFLCTGSASAFRDRPGGKVGTSDFRPSSNRATVIRDYAGKSGRGDFRPSNSGASVIRDFHQGKNGRENFSQSPRHVPQHRPDYRPGCQPPVHNYRPPVHNYRPPVHNYRPPVHNYRPSVHNCRPSVHHHHHSPNVHIGLGATFFWPWFGYYSGWQGASVFVSPPVGTVFVSLPLGCSTVSVGGTVYYCNDGVYYKEVPSGYVVTEPPPVQNVPVVAPPLSGGSYQTSVSTEVLNVRSGPGFRYPVILQVVLGDSLTVRGETDGWLYVETRGGQFGWVVTRYTTRWNG